MSQLPAAGDSSVDINVRCMSVYIWLESENDDVSSRKYIVRVKSLLVVKFVVVKEKSLPLNRVSRVVTHFSF
jgi:hypothetical protein